MEIALKPEHEQMVQKWVADGRFRSAEEALGAAVELLHQREELTIEEERKLVQAGIDSLERGEIRTIEDREAFIEEIRQRSLASRSTAPGETR